MVRKHYNTPLGLIMAVSTLTGGWKVTATGWKANFDTTALFNTFIDTIGGKEIVNEGKRPYRKNKK